MANVSQTPILINLEGQAFATYQQPQGAPEFQLLAIPVFPITLLSQPATVNSTTLTNIITISINSDMFLNEVDLIPSANAISNGLVAFIIINAGNQVYFIPTNSSNKVPIAIQTIFEFTLPPPYFMFIPNGSNVQVWANISSGSSTLQILLLGFNASGVQ